MALIVNGVTIPSSGVVTYNGVKLSSIVCNAVEVWKNGTLTLKEVVFNASGTFTVPNNAIDNTFYIGCTGGGGGSSGNPDDGQYGGGGSGRVFKQVTLTQNASIPITVGSGGPYGYSSSSEGRGGTSSFGAYASCAGGRSSSYTPSGVSGGGEGAGYPKSATSSNCPAMFTLQSGAVDNTNKLYTAKSYPGGGQAGGGGGCYGAGSSGAANTGAGAGWSGAGSSGKVVIYYYVMV